MKNLKNNIFREDEVMINAACKVSLPSTLVKTIYLFFDLPPSEDEEMSGNNEKLHEMMSQIMEGLCRYK